MSGKNLCFLFPLLLLTACAKPNYQDPDDLSGKNSQALKTCQFSFQNSDLCADLVWEEKPTDSKMVSFFLKYHAPGNASHYLEPNLSMVVSLWMPSMNHGSSPVQIEKISDGIYRVFKVYFIMPGEWQIKLQLKDGSHVADEAIYQITI